MLSIFLSHGFVAVDLPQQPACYNSRLQYFSKCKPEKISFQFLTAPLKTQFASDASFVITQ
jgi:hypothetical protein